MLHTLETGTVQSKPAGAAWANETLDSRWRPLIHGMFSVTQKIHENL